MTTIPPPGLFITGTDTGVGKTYVTAAIARLLRAEGRRVGVYKPVLSGCATNLADCAAAQLDTSQDDDVRLWNAAGRPGDVSRVCPQRFLAPLAAPVAAQAENRTVDSLLLRTGLDYWRQRSEIVLVEGAGGLMSPVTADEYVADLAADMSYPLLVVAPNILGTLNQILQTLITAAAFRRGLPVAGVVLNHPTSPAANSAANTNYGELQKRLTTRLTCLDHAAREFSPSMNWYALASCMPRSADFRESPIRGELFQDE